MDAQLVREHAMNPLKRTEHGWDIQEVDSGVKNKKNKKNK